MTGNNFNAHAHALSIHFVYCITTQQTNDDTGRRSSNTTNNHLRSYTLFAFVHLFTTYLISIVLFLDSANPSPDTGSLL